jgi:hypothetical protein
MYRYAPALAVLSGILAAGVSSAADKVADPYVGYYEGTYTPADGKGEPAIGTIRTSTRNPGEYLILIRCPLWFPSTGRFDPLVQVPLRGGLQTIGWAFERPGGGRSFGFTGLHDLKTLGVDGVRKLLLNAILWTAKINVPAQGVPSTVKPEELLPVKPGLDRNLVTPSATRK